MKLTKEELQKQANEAWEKLREIEDREWREKNRDLVGKCFKYPNNYGSGYPGWWLYAKVTEAKARMGVKCFQFQTDCNGTIDIERARMAPHIGSDNWKPIPVSEFNRAWAATKKRIAGMKP
jgi:hypothetical protein